MKTPLQQCRQAMAELGFELMPEEARAVRGVVFAEMRLEYLKIGVRCPIDDDAFGAWLQRRGINPYPTRRMN